MRRVPWLRRVLSGLALLHVNSNGQVAADSSGFSFNGSSSDKAQQFRDLYDAGYNATTLVLTTTPDDVTTRLSKYSLSFGDLPPLLQRTVLWDTGYVAQYGEDSAFSTIYTLCTNASTMADIAVSLAQYENAGCEAISCYDRFGNLSYSTTYRSDMCTETQMAVRRVKCVNFIEFVHVGDRWL